MKAAARGSDGKILVRPAGAIDGVDGSLFQLNPNPQLLFQFLAPARLVGGHPSAPAIVSVALDLGSRVSIRRVIAVGGTQAGPECRGRRQLFLGEFRAPGPPSLDIDAIALGDSNSFGGLAEPGGITRQAKYSQPLASMVLHRGPGISLASKAVDFLLETRELSGGRPQGRGTEEQTG